MKKDIIKYPIFIFLTFFTLYLYTISSTISFEDSGEIAAASYFLGIPHASGYPIFLLVRKLSTFLPAGDIGFRINLLSSFLGALNILLFYSLFYLIFRTNLKGIALFIIPFISSCCFSFSFSGWYFALLGDKYSFNILFSLLCCFFLYQVYLQKSTSAFLLPFYIGGLGLITHPTFIPFLFLLWLFIFLLSAKSYLKKLLPIGVFLLLASFSFLVFMPLRSAISPTFKDRDMSSYQGFFNSVSRSETHLFILPKQPKEKIIDFLLEKKYFISISGEEGYLGKIGISKFLLQFLLSSYTLFKEYSIFTFFIFFGLFYLWKEKREIFVFTLLWFLIYFLPPIFIFDIPVSERGDWYIWDNLKIVPFSLWMGAGFIFFYNLIKQNISIRLSNIFLVILILITTSIFFLHFPYFNKLKNISAKNVGLTIFKQVSDNSILFLNDYDLYVLLKYLQVVENERKDIKLVGDELTLIEFQKELEKENIIVLTNKDYFNYKDLKDFENKRYKFCLEIIKRMLKVGRPIYICYDPINYYLLKGEIPLNFCIPIKKIEDFDKDRFRLMK